MAAPLTSSRGDQLHCERRTSELFCSSWLSTEVDLLFQGFLATFCCLAPFCGLTSHSLSFWTGLFFFRSGIAFSPRSARNGGVGAGSVGETWDFVASFEVDTLFRVAMRSLKLLFSLFNAISPSSSLEELSGWVITKGGEWTPECLSVSSSTSEMVTIGAHGFSSSSKWNLSTSSSSDRREEAISSSGVTYFLVYFWNRLEVQN